MPVEKARERERDEFVQRIAALNSWREAAAVSWVGIWFNWKCISHDHIIISCMDCGWMVWCKWGSYKLTVEKGIAMSNDYSNIL